MLDHLEDNFLTGMVRLGEELIEMPGYFFRYCFLLLQNLTILCMKFAYFVLHSVLNGGSMKETCVLFSFFQPFDPFLLAPVDLFLFTSLFELVQKVPFLKFSFLVVFMIHGKALERS